MHVKQLQPTMIISFQDQTLEACWRRALCDKIHHDVRSHVIRKLDLLELVSSIEELDRIPGCRLAPLHGSKNLYKLQVDGLWSLVFRYEAGGFRDIWIKQGQATKAP
jgi:plasmid maintenance system killer protein